MKKRLLRTAVSTLALVSMLMQNTYGVYAAVGGLTLPDVPEIVVEREDTTADTSVDVAVDTTTDSTVSGESKENNTEGSSSEQPKVEVTTESGTPIETVDGDLDVADEKPTSDVSHDDEVMPISETDDALAVKSETKDTTDAVDIEAEDSTIDIGVTSEYTDIDSEEVAEDIEDDLLVDTALDANIDVLENQIAGSGLDSISVFIDTSAMNTEDSFRILFTGPEGAIYDTAINDNMFSTSQGTYEFSALNKEGFNIRAVSDSGCTIKYSSENGTPVISIISEEKNDTDKSIATKAVTLQEGSPVPAVYGVGFENIKIDFDTTELLDDTKFALVVNTDADAIYNGFLIDGKISSLDKNSDSVVIENLLGNEVTVYAVSEDGSALASDVISTDSSDGSATIKIIGKAEDTKRVYTYEDEFVSVTATLSDPKAVPDSAEFRVTPINSKNAVATYLEAINTNTEEEVECTEDNTLLYDVAFLVDKKDEDGNVIVGEKVEFEPENGTVNIEIIFKDSQISGELGAEAASDVTVYHLPLVDKVKDFVDKAADATIFDVADVKVEEVKANVDINENSDDSVSLTLSDLSVIAVKVDGDVQFAAGPTRTYDDMLGSAKNIGVVANEITLKGHLETNLATGSLHGEGPLQGPRNGGMNGVSYIGAYDGGNLIIDSNATGGKMLIYTTETAAKNFGNNTTEVVNGKVVPKRSSFVLDMATYDTQAKIASKISSFVNEVYRNSEAAFNVDTATRYSTVKNNQGRIDISTRPAGTYYINCKAEDGFTTNNLDITLREDQNIIFNIENTSVAFGQYKCTIKKADGTGNIYSNSTQASTDDDPVCQRIIFNCPNATTAQTSGVTAGTFIVPKATFDTNSVAAGWLVANVINKIGGQEWHCVFHDMPDPFYSGSNVKFTVEKTVENIFIDDRNHVPNFNFELYETNSNYYTDVCYSSADFNAHFNDTKCARKLETKTITNADYSNNKATVDFSEIAYNDYRTEGTYYKYYVIKEPPVANWNPDPSQGDKGGSIWAHIQVTIGVTKTTENGRDVYTTTVNDVTYAYKLNGRSLNGAAVKSCGNTSTPVIEFTNVRNGGQPVKHAFEATKSFNGEWPEGKTFTFRLEPLDSTNCGSANWVSGRAPMPTVISEGATAVYNTDGSIKYIECTISKDTPNLLAYFGEVSYPYENPEGEHTEPSTEDHGVRCRFYMYKIYEVLPEGANAGNDYIVDGIQYDAHEQYIKVIINQINNEANGNMIATKTVHGSVNNVYCGGQLNEIVFNNTKIGEASIEIEGSKTITPNNYEMTDGEFKFEITANSASAPMPANAEASIVVNASNKTEGVFRFDPITFTTADIGKTYIYTVKEKQGSKPGMNYSFAEYYVKVNVSRNGGVINVTKEVTKKDASGKNMPITFANSFSAEGHATFEAKKIFNRALTEGQFKFDLYLSEDALFDEATDTKIASAVGNDEALLNGSTAVGDIDFGYTANYTYADIDKTFYYFAKEIPGDTAATGITYSNALYRYTVSIDGVSDSEDDKIGTNAGLIINKKVEIIGADGSASEFKDANGYKVPEFTNTYNASGTGSLVVNKIWNGTGNLANKTFTFSVVQTSSKGGAALTGGYSKEASVNGAGTVTFGGTATDKISFTEEGDYYFTVKEINIPSEATSENGYTYEGITYDPTDHYVVMHVVDNGNGSLSVDTIEDANGNVISQVDITNTYNIADTEVYIEGTKELRNKKLEADKYEFTISAAAGTPMPKETTVSNGDGGRDKDKFGFGPIKYTSADAGRTYTYTVSEGEKTEPGVRNDTSIYTVTVTVSDDGAGNLSIDKQYKIGTELKGEIKFVNNYVPDGTAEIMVHKVFTSDVKNLRANDFEFELSDKDKNRIGNTVKNDANGDATFPVISYAISDLNGEEETFTYYVREILPAGGVQLKNKYGYGYIYDVDANGNAIYHKVTVKVTNNEVTGKLDTEVTYESPYEYANGTKAAKIVNEYTALGKTTIGGTKTMVGRKIGKDEVITVYLKPVSAVDIHGNKITNEISDHEDTATVTRDASDNYNGTFSFKELTYTKAGTYVYTVGELVGSEADTQYDDTLYTVTVVVADATISDVDKIGELTCTASYKVGDTPEKEISFINRCEASGTFTPVASKTFVTKKGNNAVPFGAGDFKFEITDANGTTEVPVGANGYAAFSTYTYSDPGTYEYFIKEKQSSDTFSNVDFDLSEYKIVVEVTETEGSTYDVAATYYKKNSEDNWAAIDGHIAEFKNEYKTSGSVSFDVYKVIKDSFGTDITATYLLPEGFAFDLYEGTTVKTQAKNDISGKASFTISYDESDLKGEKTSDGKFVKYYTIKENQDNKKAGYDYSDSEYVAVVTLEDNKQGHIDTDVKIVNPSVMPENHTGLIEWFKDFTGITGLTKAEFVNTYEAYGKIDISAVKTLNGGKSFDDGDFEFKLSGGTDAKPINDVKPNVGNTVTFDTIYYTSRDIGTHVYTVEETNKTLAGVENTKVAYTVTVTVSNDPEKGALRVNAAVVDNNADGYSATFSNVNVEDATITDPATNKSITAENMGTCTVGPLSFVNEYRREDTTITVGGSKLLSGLTDQDISDYDGQFSFVMTNAKGNPKNYESTKSCGAFGTDSKASFTFDTIRFTQNDLAIKDTDNNVTGYVLSRTFKYVIKETEGTLSNIDYDKSEKEITITLRDDQAGHLIASVDGYEDSSDVATFTNTYVANDSIVVNVTKTVVGTKDKSKEFKFILSGTDIEDQEATLKAGETKTFAEPIEFSYDQVKNAEGGKYVADYTVIEDQTNKPSYYEYSNAVYKIHVEVTLNSDKTLNIKKWTGDAPYSDSNVYTGNAFTFEYENVYTPEPNRVVISGKKVISGAPKLIEEYPFEFKLESAEGNPKAYEGENQVTDANGAFRFTIGEFSKDDLAVKDSDGNITGYDKERTFQYVLSEVPADEDSIEKHNDKISYTATPKTITVTVTDNYDGTLSVVASPYDVETGLTFTNKFESDDTVSFSAEKTVINHAIENIFKFKLEDISKADNKKMSEPEIIYNSGSNVNFETVLTYNQNDVGKEFIYKISEVVDSDAVKPYRYNIYNNTYYVKVDVAIVDGVVKATPNYYTDETCQTPTSVASFVNEYHSNTDVTLSGKKHAINNAGGTYTFELYELPSNNLIDSKSVTAKDKAADEVSYSFDTIPYTEADMIVDGDYVTEKTINYVVKEANSGRLINGVQYSAEVYNVTVKLTYDDKTKELVATPTVLNSSNSSVDVDELDFTNVYSDENSLPLTGTKNVTGKQIDKDGTYTFKLSKDGVEVATTSNVGSTFVFVPSAEGASVKYLRYDQTDVGTTYTYTVSEVSSTDGTEIDSAIYTVTDAISKNEETGKLTITRTVKNAAGTEVSKKVNTDASNIVFNNTYKAYGKVELPVTKIMNNKKLVDGEFEFVIKDSNGQILKDKNGNEYRIKNTAAELSSNGTAVSEFKFPIIEYSEESLKENGAYVTSKTFSYVVEEVIPSTKTLGIDYSKVSYEVGVELTLGDPKDKDANGIVPLKVKTKVNRIDSSVVKETGFFSKLLERVKALFGLDGNDDIVFENSYIADGEWKVEGTKTMEGRKLSAGDFTFILTEITADGKTVTDRVGLKNVERSVTVENKKNGDFTGSVVFDSSVAKWLKYSVNDAGTHYYKIEEFEPEEKTTADSYDKSVYIYTVEVEDNKLGVLTPTVVSITKDGVDVTDDGEAFEFINKYQVYGNVHIDGTKVMEGRGLLGDVYSFTITDEATGAKATVQNDSEGKIVFNNDISFLNYNKAGTYTYIISEDDFDVDGVKKLTSDYRITVVAEEYVVDGKPLYNGLLSTRIHQVDIRNENGDWDKVTDYDDVSYFTFTNKYEASAAIKLTGKKHLKRYAQELESKEINATESINGEFAFVAKRYETDDRSISGKVLWQKEVRCSADGSYSIDLENYTMESLKNLSKPEGYDAKKTFYYTLEEKNEEKAGIDYDTKVYAFNVDVEANPKSSKLNVSVTDANGKDISATVADNATYTIADLDFTNIKPDFTSVQGTKTWVDNVKDAATRPTLTIRLYAEAGGEKKEVATTEIKAPNSSYSFTNLPVIDENGNAITYSVTEDAVPGYASVQEGFNFTNTAGKIQIRKVIKGTDTSLEGAELAIIDAAGKTIESWTSDKLSHVVAAELKAGAEYILRETSAPKGYALAEDKKFTVPADGSDIVVVMEDPEIVGSVKLKKLDAETRNALSGAEFALYSNDGARIYATGTSGEYKYSKSSSNGRFVVNGAGEITVTDLPYGTYYFMEIVSPKGYVLSNEKSGFSILKNGETAEVTVLNTKEVGSVRLTKTNANGSRTLQGAVFELYAKTPSSLTSAIASTLFSNAYYRVGSYTTDASGVIYVDNLPWDDYYFVEVKAPTGYKVNTDTNGDSIAYTFTISDTSSNGVNVNLGKITNKPTTPPDTPTPPTPPTTPPETPTPTTPPTVESTPTTPTTPATPVPPVTIPEVAGDRTPPAPVVDSGRRPGGVIGGVLGVRAAPKQGVLGERVGPVTGDTANIILWIVVMTLCFAAIIAAALVGNSKTRRRRVQQK